MTPPVTAADVAPEQSSNKIAIRQYIATDITVSEPRTGLDMTWKVGGQEDISILQSLHGPVSPVEKVSLDNQVTNMRIAVARINRMSRLPICTRMQVKAF